MWAIARLPCVASCWVPWEPHDPHIDVRRGFLGVARPEPSTSLVDWLTPARTLQPLTPKDDDPADWSRRAIVRIPDEVRCWLAPFRLRQWLLLHFVSRDLRALDLIDASPALAWMLGAAPGERRLGSSAVMTD